MIQINWTTTELEDLASHTACQDAGISQDFYNKRSAIALQDFALFLSNKRKLKPKATGSHVDDGEKQP